MKFSKYILACGCLCNVGFAAYAGEDAAITELRESIDSLKSQVTALKAKDEAIEEQNQTFDQSLTDIKTQMTETSQKLETISQKLESSKTAAPADNEEDVQIKNKVTELESSLNEIKASIPTPEDLAEIKSSLAQANASITTLTQDIEAQKAVNEQQTLDLGKNEARLDKIERSNTTSAAANVAGGLLGTALQGGLGLLSQKLNANSLKDSLAKGEPMEDLTEGMTPEEKLELEEIKQEIISGKSDQEIQEKLDSLKTKVADREEKQIKFPETIFYGIDPFDSSYILHLLNLGRNAYKLDPNSILENIQISNERKKSVDYVNTMIDYINLIYDWGQKGAKLEDVTNNIKVISGGTPKKIVKSELLRQTSENQSSPMQTTQQSNFMSTLTGAVSNFASQSISSISGNEQAVSNMIPSGQNVSVNQNFGNGNLSEEVLSKPMGQQGDVQLNSASIPDQVIENQSQNEMNAQRTQFEGSLNQMNNSLPTQGVGDSRENMMQVSASQTMEMSQIQGTDALSQESLNTQGGQSENQINQLGLSNSVQMRNNSGKVKDSSGNMVLDVSNSQVAQPDLLISRSPENVNQTQSALEVKSQQNPQINNHESRFQTIQNANSENQGTINQEVIANSQTISDNGLSINQSGKQTLNTQTGTNKILPNLPMSQETSIQNSANSGTQAVQENNKQAQKFLNNNQLPESQMNNSRNQMQGTEKARELNIQSTSMT